ncbi:MAG: hypothetical protein M0P73_15645 [Syntrophobacterales bacterium]|jgi:hypothetical protein|nr:hypothetical protein [Syntrophobacterales bacterium]
MARSKGWTRTVFISLVVGVIGASIFWMYSSFFHEHLAQQVAEDLQSQARPGEAKGVPVNLKKLPVPALGSRFQMVTDGKQVFLTDLKEGRVWRYFHQTKEEGFSTEDEGFLPVPFYYAGKKHYTASEIEPPPATSGNSPQAAPEGKQPR